MILWIDRVSSLGSYANEHSIPCGTSYAENFRYGLDGGLHKRSWLIEGDGWRFPMAVYCVVCYFWPR